jgi:hypothetical protein
VLIDGVVTRYEVTPTTDPGTSTLVVYGKDITALMDLEDKIAPYPNQSDFVIFSQVIGAYAQFGLIPAPTTTTDTPLMTERIPWQHENDLAFVRRLAERNGFVFYTEPLPFGTSIAYFGPENRLGVLQPPLTINMGTYDNLKSVSVSNDAMAPVAAKTTVLDPISGTDIPIPTMPSLRVPPLSSSPTQVRRTTILRNGASRSPSEAMTGVIAAGSRADEPVYATGEVDSIRYGGILRARKPVGLRGVGKSFDGSYYVRSVHHTIARGTYTQRFRASRDGLGSLLPALPPS